MVKDSRRALARFLCSFLLVTLVTLPTQAGTGHSLKASSTVVFPKLGGCIGLPSHAPSVFQYHNHLVFCQFMFIVKFLPYSFIMRLQLLSYPPKTIPKCLQIKILIFSQVFSLINIERAYFQKPKPHY